MELNIKDELMLFNTQLIELEKIGYKLERPATYAAIIKPKTLLKDEVSSKPITCCIFAATHGNEIVGIKVINELLKSLCQRSHDLTKPLALAIANYAAAEKNQRYIDRDLNRSFNLSHADGWEVQRALELKPLLEQSRYFLDLHQTKAASQTPFFIFPYQRKSVALATTICPYIPIVTHWDDGFSKEGLCTDEYVNQNGGLGLTVELGQNGCHPFQLMAGIHMSQQFMYTCTTMDDLSQPISPDFFKNIYTWSRVIDYPKEGYARLKPGYKNFDFIKSGDIIGEINGKPLIAPEDSFILFPYYGNNETEQKQRPAYLLRLLRPINTKDRPWNELKQVTI